MSNLDINTPKGLVTRLQEQDMMVGYHKARPQRRYVRTKDDANAADCAVWNLNLNRVIAIGETKCRDASREQLASTKWNYEWLITDAKILILVRRAVQMRVKLVGFLYLTRSGVCLVQDIYDGVKQEWVGGEPRVETKLQTQATVNGGKKTVPNRMINMRKTVFEFAVVESERTREAIKKAYP